MINLEEEARKRRERLLRAKNGNQEVPSVEVKELKDNSQPQTFSKKEATETIDSVFVAPEGLIDASGAEILSLDSKIPETLETQAKALLAKHESSASTFFDLNSQVDTDLLTTKGQNADLKREYERRTSLLHKQTKRAIVDIVRERLAQEEKLPESE